MQLSDNWRLALYVAVVVLPIWQEFFTKSADFSLRGLAMPIISSLSAAAAVTLAKTSAKRPTEPPKVEVINPPNRPVETHEANP